MFIMKITALKKIYNPKEPIFLDYSFEKLAQFIITPRDNKEKIEIPAWSPATFTGDKLTNDNVVEISCAVFDIDEGLEWEVHNHFKDYQYIAHTSFSHCDTKHKWRLVIPFTTPVPSHLWEGAWMQCKRFFFEMTGKPMDEKCKDARRFYFVAAGEPIMGSNPKTYCNGLDEYLVHVNYGQCMSIDFQKCENYKAQLEQEQKDKIERMKRRYNAIQSLPQYMQNPKESLHLKLSTDASYREQLGNKIGGRNSGGANPRMTGWDCPSCGRNDATYFYVHPLGNRTTAQCGHMNSCGQWFTLFQLGRDKGVC
jgi:hypothetical protein